MIALHSSFCLFVILKYLLSSAFVTSSVMHLWKSRFSLFSFFRSHPISCLDVSQLVIFILQYLLHCFWTFRLSVLHHLRYTDHSFLLWFSLNLVIILYGMGFTVFGQIRFQNKRKDQGTFCLYKESSLVLCC